MMGRSKLKKKLQKEKPAGKRVENVEESTSAKIPIDNLPENFLRLHVKTNTKIRNILNYALKQFPSYNSIVWTASGHAIGKVISCAEIFKRKHEGLHQVTKLSYTTLKKLEKNVATCRLPEIHILLTKDIKDTSELGYQAPGDHGEFPEKTTESKTNPAIKSTDNVPCIDRQFPIMENRGKRKYTNKPKKNIEPLMKKSKVS
ncbi:ribonuclease P protein subunit p25-like protein [Cardiocondyla obscurior]|uniref:ribonuclease P protein subunit p25-like protein n=1 Tax=Cardiocondyla obscurior TaxID=286306 RepID=UPI0039655ADF